MNKVVLIGRLTRDVELKKTESAKSVAMFTLAINRATSSEEQTADFINIIVWEKLAENCKKYLKKGSQAAIEGRIQTRTYDASDGTKKYITEIVANNVEFIGSTEKVKTDTSSELPY